MSVSPLSLLPNALFLGVEGLRVLLFGCTWKSRKVLEKISIFCVFCVLPDFVSSMLYLLGLPFRTKPASFPLMPFCVRDQARFMASMTSGWQ